MSEPAEKRVYIVVGAHLRAEVADRPLGYRLREKMLDWIATHPLSQQDGEGEQGEGGMGGVVVCSDLWYLNDESVRGEPTVSIGGPGVNALGAYWADKLPSAFVIDDVLMVQMDVELGELAASVWGMDHEATVAAVDVFVERYMGGFLEGVFGAGVE